jgi:glycosyltransferase involved in cell wall biosynthesis
MISIIVPLYNQDRFIIETLQSVAKQTYAAWECIIVNDGSTDASAEKVQEWIKDDHRFLYYYKTNGGLSSARNYGVTKAQFDIILPLDADDTIHPDLLQYVAKAYEDPKIDVVSYNVAFFGVKTGPYKLPKYNYKKLLLQNCFIACTPFKKSAFQAINGYDEDLVSFEDWDFWIRLLNTSSTVIKLEQTLYYYRKHANESLTNTFSQNPKLYYDLYDYVYEKNKHIYDKHFKNPILAYQDNELLLSFNTKVKNTVLFKLYAKLKKWL